jgi:hypothetical protein
MRSSAKWPGDLQNPASAVHPRAAPRRGEVATRAPHPPGETFHVEHRLLSNSWRGNAVEDPQPRNGASPFGVLTRRPGGAEGVGLGRAMHLCRPRSDGHPGSRPQRGKGPVSRETAPGTPALRARAHSRGTEPLSPARPSVQPVECVRAGAGVRTGKEREQHGATKAPFHVKRAGSGGAGVRPVSRETAPAAPTSLRTPCDVPPSRRRLCCGSRSPRSCPWRETATPYPARRGA